MSFNLQPKENFVIVRQLSDHTDETTYYVRATVRDSVTDTVIKVVYLVDQDNGRFKKDYEVPSDVSGLGRYIDITTEVFTDSGYTTKASTYGDENNTYLIFDRIARIGGGGGGGSDIDYKKIAKIFMDAISGIKIPEQPDLSALASILKSLDTLQTAVKGIEIPKNEKVEFAPVIAQIKALENTMTKVVSELGKKVSGIKIEDTDLSPVIKKMERIDISGVRTSVDEVSEKMGELSSALSKSLSSDNLLKLEKSMKDISGLLNEFVLKVQLSIPREDRDKKGRTSSLTSKR